MNFHPWIFVLFVGRVVAVVDDDDDDIDDDDDDDILVQKNVDDLQRFENLKS